MYTMANLEKLVGNEYFMDDYSELDCDMNKQAQPDKLAIAQPDKLAIAQPDKLAIAQPVQ